jgi:hypothetical protein
MEDEKYKERWKENEQNEPIRKYKIFIKVEIPPPPKEKS